MQLPYYQSATIDLGKLTGYVLNLSHPEGRHKARVFLSALGITSHDADWLAKALLAALPDAVAYQQSENEWGTSYRVDTTIHRDTRCATVRTAWLVQNAQTRLW